MAYIARQPNGLLCRFSYIVDTVTHINMTEEDYIELCAELARQEARRNLQSKHFVEPFSRILKDVRLDNMSRSEWKDCLEKMGFYDEKD